MAHPPTKTPESKLYARLQLERLKTQLGKSSDKAISDHLGISEDAVNRITRETAAHGVALTATMKALGYRPKKRGELIQMAQKWWPIWEELKERIQEELTDAQLLVQISSVVQDQEEHSGAKLEEQTLESIWQGLIKTVKVPPPPRGISEVQLEWFASVHARLEQRHPRAAVDRVIVDIFLNSRAPKNELDLFIEASDALQPAQEKTKAKRKPASK